MDDRDAPYHAHVYYISEQRSVAEALRGEFLRLTSAESERQILFVGQMTERGVGPHPIPQYEVHFLRRSLPSVVSMIEESGLRALVHPLTDDDVADHTSLAQWIGEPLELDLGTLDPPGMNQGIARFGRTDF